MFFYTAHNIHTVSNNGKQPKPQYYGVNQMLIDEMLKVDDISKIIKKSKSTIYRWANAGKFPKPIKINNSTLWRVSEVNAWLENPSVWGESK